MPECHDPYLNQFCGSFTGKQSSKNENKVIWGHDISKALIRKIRAWHRHHEPKHPLLFFSRNVIIITVFSHLRWGESFSWMKRAKSHKRVYVKEECGHAFTDRCLEAAVQLCEVRVTAGQWQHPLLCHGALDVIILQNDVLLQHLDRENPISAI